jgi:hypothetical protein
MPSRTPSRFWTNAVDEIGALKCELRTLVTTSSVQREVSILKRAGENDP